MIANAMPIVTVRCMDTRGREKNVYPTRKAARKWARRLGLHVYHCDDHFHLTSRTERS